MAYAVSPNHTLEEYDHPWTIDDKIEVFIDRIRGWQIGPALAMQASSIRHRGFAQLHIVMSFFEVIGKYRAGFVGAGLSGKYFKEGLRWTFVEIDESDTEVLNSFYTSIRNGLYHAGLTMPNVILRDDIPASFGYNKTSNLFAISPDRFVNDIDIRFEAYAKELKDPANIEFRQAFEKRFDDESELKPK